MGCHRWLRRIRKAFVIELAGSFLAAEGKGLGVESVFSEFDCFDLHERASSIPWFMHAVLRFAVHRLITLYFVMHRSSREQC